MGRAVIRRTWRRKSALALCAALGLSLPDHAFAWGKNGHRLVVNKAIDTLPQDIRPFFESTLALLSQHVTDPLDAIAKSPAERHNHFILLDKYGRFPFEALPRNYKAAVTKFGKPKLDAKAILLADRNARHGENSFTDEYYDRFYDQAAAILIRQLSDAATDVGSFWLTAWVNAGRPQLPR